MKNSKIAKRIQKSLDESEGRYTGWAKIKKVLFGLPTPMELGRAEYNALPSRDFTPESTDYCWEDWHIEVKRLHPVKYWFTHTARDYIRYNLWLPVTRPIKDAHYWFVSHFIPKRRYHMLDLRQPNGYRYGWSDVPEKMLYAMFNLLKEYFDEKPYDLSNDYSLEEINADAGLKAQYETLQEAKFILHWWQVQRQKEDEIYQDLLHRWSELRKSKDAREAGRDKEMWDVLRKAEEDQEKKMDEMIARLMKIRRSLWT